MAGRGLSPALGRVGPYEILDLLGQGGMAAVYEAAPTVAVRYTSGLSALAAHIATQQM